MNVYLAPDDISITTTECSNFLYRDQTFTGVSIHIDGSRPGQTLFVRCTFIDCRIFADSMEHFVDCKF